MSELLEIIGRNVRRLREEKGWNQTELGFHADTSPSIISLIENGKRNPSTATLAKIAGALGVEVADLFPKADAPPSPEPEGVSEEERRYLRALFGSWGHHIDDQNEKWGPLLRDLPEDPTAEEYESGCKVIEEAFATYESILNAMARYGVLETLDRFVDDLQDDEPVPDEIRQEVIDLHNVFNPMIEYIFPRGRNWTTRADESYRMQTSLDAVAEKWAQRLGTQRT